MVRRLLALIAAAAMVAAAFAYRSSRQGSSPERATDLVAPGAVVCAQELGPVCDAVRADFPAVTVEPAATTFDRVVGARSVRDAGVAVWIAAGPWADMVDAARPGKPELFGDPEPVASTPIVAVARKGEDLAACPGAPTWRCLGDAAQDPAFRLAGDSPSAAAHLFIRAALAAGFVGKEDFAINDFDELPDGAGWLDNVERALGRAPSFGASTFPAFLVARGSAQVFVTTGAAVATAGELPEFEVTVPSPVATLGAFVAVARGVAVDVDDSELTEALLRAGWKAPPMPASDGLPSPGVLVALRERTK